MRWLLLLLLPNLAFAATLTIEGPDFTGQQVSIEYADTEIIRVVQENNTVDIPRLEPMTIRIIADRIYVGRTARNTVLMKPIARISGKVIDQQENLLQHIPLRTLCTSSVIDAPNSTDEFGFFTIQEVGLGTCDITAILNGKAYSKHVVANESKHYIITIETRETQATPVGIIVLVAILVAAFAAFFIMRKPTNHEPTKRQQDLMQTLSEREKDVVECLFYSGNLTQSQLRHKTQMPKSSLHRTLQSLERKNIAKRIEEAGVQKIVLTTFFDENRNDRSRQDSNS